MAFRLGDALSPDQGQILAQVGPELVLNGEVAFFSDRGHDAGYFAIISVAGIETPLVVPAACLCAAAGAKPVEPVLSARGEGAEVLAEANRAAVERVQETH